MTLVERIKMLADEKKTNFAEIERKTGISNGQIRRWDTSSPKVENLKKVADFLNTSIDYLVDGKEKENSDTDVNSLFRINTSNLDPEIKEEVEEELRNYSEFLIQKALDMKAKRNRK